MKTRKNTRFFVSQKLKVSEKTILIIFLVLLGSFAYAQETDLVRILKLHYENEDIDILENIVKFGFFPDRKIQPEKGYRLEIISETGEKLYEFIFKVPIKIFTDVENEQGELEGGMILLNETTFAFILPYFEDEKEINIYNDENELLAKQIVKEESVLSPKQGISWLLILIVLIFVAVFLWKRKHKDNPKVRKHYSV